jgi:hypothetical protein
LQCSDQELQGLSSITVDAHSLLYGNAQFCLRVGNLWEAGWRLPTKLDELVSFFSILEDFALFNIDFLKIWIDRCRYAIPAEIEIDNTLLAQTGID